jgi:galactokinase
MPSSKSFDEIIKEIQTNENEEENRKETIHVSGRVCLLGEHSDWVRTVLKREKLVSTH